MPTDVYLEVGSKRVFACALAWPGWGRAGRSQELALEALAAYLPPYRAVAGRPGVRSPKGAGARLGVVGRRPGSATTDFGAPGQAAGGAREPVSAAAAA